MCVEVLVVGSYTGCHSTLAHGYEEVIATVREKEDWSTNDKRQTTKGGTRHTKGTAHACIAVYVDSNVGTTLPDSCMPRSSLSVTLLVLIY